MPSKTIPADAARPCNRPGCGGTWRPTGKPDYDSDGSALVGLRCDSGCGMQSFYSWIWK
ncbi:hypothetical protein [Thermoactinospora rubra]|uniref:hypothetical protein n=1 Tax=Thermoactinospora rubra TaxID=1088767 RepID=UPI001301BC58|nr:hypothetical protein [Thermoactinospora rubra]